MERIMKFDNAKPLDDMGENEKTISQSGGMTVQKEQQLVDKKPVYDRQEAYNNILNKPKEELEKMAPFERSVFNKYGLDINNEEESAQFDSLSEEMLLERLQVLEATILLARSTKDTSQENGKYYAKLVKEYSEEVGRYQVRYNKEYNPSVKTNIEEAENILLKYMNPENRSSEKKDVPELKKRKPEEIFAEELI